VDALYACHYRELYENHWWWRARERFILAILRGLQSQENWGSILDKGCGEGLSFDSLGQFGEVEGVETDPSLATKNDRWEHRIHLSDFEAFQSNKQYSLILMLDVLEHFRNPTLCLRRSEELLDSRGSLLITVPAFSCLWTTHDDLNCHVSRFTKQTQ
jgi:2-polyprenyl-3-methyl-5-hydroxy-6-metoxy-1,4-benzoquinol methylase